MSQWRLTVSLHWRFAVVSRLGRRIVSQCGLTVVLQCGLTVVLHCDLPLFHSRIYTFSQCAFECIVSGPDCGSKGVAVFFKDIFFFLVLNVPYADRI